MKPLTSPQISSRKIDYLVLIAMTVVIYARTLGHEFQMSWDDNWYLVYNDSIRGFSWQNLKTIFSSIYQANYAPLQMLSYMLDYSLWGMNPGGFLATNIIFHTLNGLLLYRLLLSLHGERLFALVAAAFFLIHPLQVESVAWISCRKNVLSLFFFLLSWEAYRRYRETATGHGGRAYLVSLAAFVLSLLAKSTTLVLPLVLLVYDICFPSGERRLRLKDKIPYVLATIVFALISMRVQQADFQGGIRIPYHGGSPLATLYTMLPVFCLYLLRLVWPTGLSAIYAPPVHTSLNVTVVMASLVIAVVIWAGIHLFRYDRRLGFWFLFFWIGLIPFAQIVPILWLITDRYINVAIIGAAALTGAAAVYLRNRLGSGGTQVLYGIITIWLLTLAIVSSQRVGAWRDSLTLWSDAVTKTPASAKAWGHYGETLRISGQVDAARQAYERGLKLDPANPEVLAGLGVLYTEDGNLDNGFELLNKLVEVKPDHVTGWASLGTNYLKRGNYAEAEKSYKHAQSLQPEAWQVLALLGNLARVQGHLKQARVYYVQVESKLKENGEIAYHLACVESMAGNREAALVWLEKALQRGYGDYMTVRADQQLSALDQDPRFDDLLKRYISSPSNVH